jgi:REP element-mobilizing transposase RayT
MAELFHVNFHTHRNQSLFLDGECARAIEGIFDDVARRHHITWLARSIMPTHVHFLIVAFPDLMRDRIIQLLKGASAREFFQRFPPLGQELGGHLWQQGYDWILITSNRQLHATLDYIAANRPKIGLPSQLEDAANSGL